MNRQKWNEKKAKIIEVSAKRLTSSVFGDDETSQSQHNTHVVMPNNENNVIISI